MVEVGRVSLKELDCPFCKKAKIKANYKESYMQANISRISAGKKVKYSKTPEKWEVLEDCPQCGARKKDIQDMYDGKQKPETREERLKRLRASGLPTQIEM